MMPIWMLNTGEVATIRRITGKPEMKKHLEALGFTAGSTVEALQSSGGNLILKIRDSKMCITRGMAEKIMVDP